MEAFGADVVVIATGSLPDESGFQRFGPVPGHIDGMGQRQRLAGGGCDVAGMPARETRPGTRRRRQLARLRHRLASGGTGSRGHTADTRGHGGQGTRPQRRRLPLRSAETRLGVAFITDSAIKQWHGDGATIVNLLDGSERREPYDALILATPNVADTTLVDGLAGSDLEVHMVGDCVAPRWAVHAIYEGRKWDIALMAGSDPLLQPYQLKQLTLRNRIMSTAHEPSYAEDGMPTDRYRLYHVEKAKGGIALTMTAGSAVVAEDSPPAFGNLHAYDDAIVPWLRRLTDECHEHGAAVMIQLTHLGRRTSWSTGDWLPVLAPSPVREPAHRTFPKQAEDWDLDRIVGKYADAAERMQAAGMDGIELEAYGHFMDGFWSPATNRRGDEYDGTLDNRLRFTFQVLEGIRAAVGPEFIVGVRMVADEDWEKGSPGKKALRLRKSWRPVGTSIFSTSSAVTSKPMRPCRK